MSCSSFTDPRSGTKCIPTRSQTICEPLLFQVYTIFGEAAAKKSAELRKCTCELIEWNSINGSSEYEINLIASSDSLYEGPLVVGEDLFWSSLSEGIMRRGPDGDISVFVPATKTFVPHGLQWDKTTNTIIVTSAENRGRGAVYRVEQDKTLTKLTNRRFLNNPNDVAVSSTGTIYFTDPYWLTQQFPISGIMGVYSIQNCRVKLERNFLFESPLAQPNGIILSEDEKKLYVTLTGASKVVKFRVKETDNKKYRRLRGLTQQRKSNDKNQGANNDCRDRNTLHGHIKVTNKSRKYTDDFEFDLDDEYFNYQSSKIKHHDDWFEHAKSKNEDDDDDDDDDRHRSKTKDDKQNFWDTYHNDDWDDDWRNDYDWDDAWKHDDNWKQKYDDDEYDDDSSSNKDFSSRTLEYEGKIEGALSAPVLPDGLAIYRNVLYVATNLDYIQIVPLDGRTGIQGIDLYDAGVSWICILMHLLLITHSFRI